SAASSRISPGISTAARRKSSRRVTLPSEPTSTNPSLTSAARAEPSRRRMASMTESSSARSAFSSGVRDAGGCSTWSLLLPGVDALEEERPVLAVVCGLLPPLPDPISLHLLPGDAVQHGASAGGRAAAAERHLAVAEVSVQHQHHAQV